MSLKSLLRTLTGKNKNVKPHTDGLKRLHDSFADGHPIRTCIKDVICKTLEGEIEIVTIPATDRFDVPPSGTRQTWENQLANQDIKPLQYFYPEGLFLKNGKETPLVDILQFAKNQNLHVKAAGSGHSYSDVATTTDCFINTHGLGMVASNTNIESRNMKPGSGRVQIAGAIESAIDQSWLASGVTLANGPVTWPSVSGESFEPSDNKTLVEMQGGIRLHYLNEVLEAWNLGIENMGGYDGQTIVGATMTSTHGTGITLPPFPDSVRSMVLCTTSPWTQGGLVGGGPDQGKNGDVYLYRIEAANNPVCDPSSYNDPKIALLQNDEAFYAAICNMGTFGIIYSFTIEVMQKYWLHENRTMTNLAAVMEKLRPVKTADGIPHLLHNRHVELIVHPYPLNEKGEVIEIDPSKDPAFYYPFYHVILEVWNIVPEPDNIREREGHRNWISGLLGKFRLSFDATATLFYNCPSLTPTLISKSMKTLEDADYINVAPKIFVNGMSQYAGFANEIAYPIEEKGKYTPAHFEAAINRIHLLAQSNRVNGNQYQTSPFSVRFVKKSNALLSMQHGVNTAMIELDLASGTFAGTEILSRFQDGEYAHGGIPHWGLEFDKLTGSNDLIGKLYPNTLRRWKAIYDIFNADGRFNNSFTDRVGFSEIEFQRS